jgi:hypothetical protein
MRPERLSSFPISKLPLVAFSRTEIWLEVEFFFPRGARKESSEENFQISVRVLASSGNVRMENLQVIGGGKP